MKYQLKLVMVLLSSLGTLTACEQQATPHQTVVVKRDVTDPVVLKQGRELYLKNCTVCHGLNAEGAPDWRQRDAQGQFPAPPLNGTGHAWHHPMSALIDTIKNGTQRLGGNMPPWKDRLNDQEIKMIIYWFQSQWPDELYKAWQRINRESQSAK